MSYTPPTLDEFITRYPEFAETPPADVNRALADAGLEVDNTWIEAHYQIAYMMLAAHLLSAHLAGTEASGQDALQSLRIGPISLSYGSRISVTDFTTTTYGQAYLALRRRSFPGIIVVTV